MKTICLVHGVGYHGDVSPLKRFARALTKETGAKCIVARWNHPGQPPPDPRNSWLFPRLRKWMHEVTMDFAYTVKALAGWGSKLPEADAYVGHSAGGVIVSTVKDKPVVLMGCPVQLFMTAGLTMQTQKVLNLMNYRDPIAAFLPGAENVIVYKPWLGSFNPLTAHINYWKSDEVLEHVAKWLNQELA